MEFAGQGRSRSIPLNESLTLEQMFSVAEQIARLHAFALKVSNFYSFYFIKINFRINHYGLEIVLKV